MVFRPALIRLGSHPKGCEAAPKGVVAGSGDPLCFLGSKNLFLYMSQETISSGQTKKCPKCQEDIQINAKKCKHCGTDLRSWIVRHPILTILIVIVLIPILVKAVSDTDKNVRSRVDSNQQTTGSNIQPKEWKEVFSIKGKGNRNTESFKTAGGRLKMTVKTSGSSVGSFSGIELKSETGRLLSGADLNISTDGSEVGTGETIVREAEAGSYYISVISGINWEVHVFEEK